jgi:hypothetical protein
VVPVGAIAALIVLAMRAGNKGGGASATPRSSSAGSTAVHGPGLLKWIVVTGAWAFGLAMVPFTVPGGLAFVSCLWVGTWGLHWLAWCVCHPFGLWRVGRAVLWLAPHLRRNHEVGRMALWSAVRGWSFSAAAVDGWIACAAVMEAERARRFADAAALVDALLAVSLREVLPSSVRVRAIPVIAQAAADRGDWSEALRRASLGRGRAARVVRLAARAHVVGDVRPAPLWAAWAMAPGRIRRYAMLRSALLPRPHEPRVNPPVRPDALDGPWTWHVRLLGRAAAGDEVALSDVIALARLWDGPLAPAGEALFRARGLELGSTRAQETFGTLRTTVTAELAVMARAARGAWPKDLDGEADMVLDLHARLGDESFEAVSAIARTRRYKRLEDLGSPLEEWYRWVRFRAALDALATRFGEDELKTAWYGGAQLAAWNWPCHLLEKYGEKAAWACHVMFRWTTEVAERCGDEEAATVNRRNAQTARQRILAA